MSMTLPEGRHAAGGAVKSTIEAGPGSYVARFHGPEADTIFGDSLDGSVGVRHDGGHRGDDPAGERATDGRPGEIMSETAFSDTIPGDSSTSQVLVIGSPVTGYINSSGDSDWFRIHMVAGVTYRLSETMSGTPLLVDPNLDIRSESGASLFSYPHNTLFGAPYAQYTPTTTGDYYISTSSHDATSGAYSIQLDDKIAASQITAFSLTEGKDTYGILETSADSDWYAVTLTAGQTYAFSMSSYSSDGVGDPSLALYNSANTQVASNDDISDSLFNSAFQYTATTSGTYYVAAGSSDFATHSNSVGIYAVNFSLSADTIGDTAATASTLAEGASVSSNIDVDNDHDWFAVTLTAGQVYDFTMNGTGAAPLEDPYLELFNASGTLLTFNDDGGDGRNAHLAYFATTTGTYYISAESWTDKDSGLTYQGGYTLSMSTGSTPTTDTVGNHSYDAATLTLGHSVDNRIDTPDDQDWFAVDLTAGVGYDFDVTSPGGATDMYLTVYDSSGTVVLAVDDDSLTGTDAHLDFEAATSGRYYVVASSSSSSGYGNYTVSAAVGDRPLLTDSIDWGTKLTPANGVVQVYFAPSGETYDGETSAGWNAYEIQQAMLALSVYSKYINLTFVQTTDASKADFKLVTATDLGDGVLAYMNPPGTGDGAGVGVFSRIGVGWDKDGGGGLEPGGLGFDTLLHELGHGLGLAHPFDGGGTSTIMTGVTDTYDYSGYGYQNQGVYTVMTYNDGWPGGPVPGLSTTNYSHGYDMSPMAIDVAALQAKYGANSTYHSGDDTYIMADPTTAGGSWYSIWDTGGNDTVTAAALAFNVTIDLRPATMYYTGDASGGAISYVSNFDYGFTIDQGVVIENAIGGSGDDVINGNAGNNILTGNDGNDTLKGNGGIDTLIGGNGNDSYYVDNSLDTIVETGNDSNDQVWSSASFVLSDGLERLTLTGTNNINGTGNSLDNVIYGNDGDNILSGGGGHDALYGGAGHDTYIVSDNSTVLSEYDNGETDTIMSSVTYSMIFPFVENLVLTGTLDLNGTGDDENNAITGNSGANILMGMSGNDTLDGGGGLDTLIGGVGNDTYIVGTAGVTVTEAAGEGTDKVLASVSYSLTDNVENLTLSGNGDINATGNAGKNILTGNSGKNVLDGGAGADIMIGGGGNDSYYVDNAGDVVTELAGGGIDTVTTARSYTLGDNVEKLTLAGANNVGGTGNALANVIVGNDGNNKLFGLVGNDTLSGGLGDDVLDGGKGADIMKGGVGDDRYYVENTGDIITEYSNQGHDTVVTTLNYALGANVEDLIQVGTHDYYASGNALDNHLTGNIGNNLFHGGDGNDVIDGGKGADKMYGGLGNDTFYVDNTGDVVVEYTNQGTDTVVSSITYTLGGAVENLTLTGSTNINGTGTSGDNILMGNGGDNILTGGKGHDILTGGLGADTFVFGLASGADTITDFSASQNDKIDLSAYHAQSTAVIHQVGADTVIDLGQGNIVTIANTTSDDPGLTSHIMW